MDSFTTQGATNTAMPAADAMPRHAASWMRETMDVVAERLRADARTLQDAGCCDSLSDLTMVQTRWVTEATRAYSDATLRFMETFIRAAAPAAGGEAAPQPEPAPRRPARRLSGTKVKPSRARYQAPASARLATSARNFDATGRISSLKS